MRGKGPLWNLQCTLVGITPAYAGKSRCKNARLCGGQDHPRLCGEKGNGFTESILSVGSPPPMRGKDSPISLSFFNPGITPAYAGKSRR